MNRPKSSWRRLLRQIHEDEVGGPMSVEFILLIGVIALPVLFFVYKFGWPAFKSYFIKGASDVGIDVPSQ